MGGSSLTAVLSLPLQAFLSDRWVSVRPSSRQSMSITSVQVFLGWPRPRPPAGLSFWTFFNQPSLLSTWPCHLSGRVWSTFARSSSCLLSKRSCELTWSLVVTQHIQWIIAQSLRCRRCKSDKAGTQVALWAAPATHQGLACEEPTRWHIRVHNRIPFPDRQRPCTASYWWQKTFFVTAVQWIWRLWCCVQAWHQTLCISFAPAMCAMHSIISSTGLARGWESLR